MTEGGFAEIGNKFPDSGLPNSPDGRFFVKFLETAAIFSTLGLRPPPAPPFNPPPHYG
jgi:hypothetical protein